MKKLIERLLVFFIGVPLVILLVLYLPFKNNLALNLAVIFFSAAGAFEFSAMLEKKIIKISRAESLLLGASAPLAATLYINFGLQAWIIPVIVTACFLWALISGIFSRLCGIETILNKIVSRFSLLIYPGFFMCALVFMGSWKNPAAVLLFLFITFANDSIAWLSGTLFGANNRGIIAVSPNKSIAGFIGGLTGSVLVAACAVILFPKILPFSPVTPLSGMLFIAVIISLCTGIAASLGDLAESAIKRSCEFKDSGNLMLGRGGVLDSIDSIAVAAPVFFLLYSLFFT